MESIVERRLAELGIALRRPPRALPPQGLCRHRAALASVRKSGRSWRVTNYRPRRG